MAGTVRGLRYTIQASNWPKSITDMGKPTPWVLPEEQRGKQDYALVARVFHPETGKMMVLLAGIEGHGTEAAADLVSNERLLADALRAAPPGWERKNLKFVVQVRVISGAADSAKVLAWHVW